MRASPLFFVLIFAISACQYLEPNQDPDLLRAKQVERVGQQSTNCGDIRPDDAQDGVQTCMAQAYDAKAPFHARFWRQGIDSEIAEGIARDRSGTLYIYRFDSAPCGGPGCAPHLTEQVCVKPYVWRADGLAHVACADPSFNEDRQ